MPQRGRISTEEKIQAIEEYQSGRGSLAMCSNKYGVSDASLRDWIRLYKTRGIEGLTPATQTRRYSIETKNMAVEEYQSGGGSLCDICTKYDISDKKILRRWIMRYNSHGDFKQPNNGGAIYMVKGRSTTQEERIEIISHCIANNKDYGKTIERYGVSYQQIYGWVRKYENNGVDGLVDRRGKRKDEASMSEVEKLRAQLKLKEAENYRLQMENEMLKKLEALERGIDID